MITLKKFSIWLCAFSAALAGAACSGNTDDSEAPLTPTLVPSTNTITADGKDAVTFTVHAGSLDVTSQSAIRCVNLDKPLNGTSFTATEAGTYTFEAVYQQQTSPQVTVTAREADKPQTSKYVRKSLVMEFTGQWCTFCPKGANYLNSLLNLSYNTDGKTKVYVLALHSNSGGQDDMSLDVARDIALAIGNPSFPAYYLDLRAPGTLGETPERMKLTTDLNETMGYIDRDEDGKKFEVPAKYPAHCGIAVKSEYDQTAKTATVTIRIASEQTERYRTALWVVEDNIRAWQKNSGVIDNNYLHRHVARRLVSGSYNGDTIGEILAGEEQSKTYTVQVDDAWNLDNTVLYALAIDADGYVNNVAECAIVGGDTGYDTVAEK